MSSITALELSPTSHHRTTPNMTMTNMNLTQQPVVLLELPSYAPKSFEGEIGDEDFISKGLRGGIKACMGEVLPTSISFIISAGVVRSG